jgi:hypothetical protein
MTPLNTLKHQITAARNAALRESIADCGRRGVHQSRGTWLCTADAGGQCGPLPAAECHFWRGTWHEIRAAIADVKANHPGVTHLYVSGGYDHADSVRDYHDGNYTPWTGTWDVLVWSRAKEAA